MSSTCFIEVEIGSFGAKDEDKGVVRHHCGAGVEVHQGFHEGASVDGVVIGVHPYEQRRHYCCHHVTEHLAQIQLKHLFVTVFHSIHLKLI